MKFMFSLEIYTAIVFLVSEVNLLEAYFDFFVCFKKFLPILIVYTGNCKRDGCGSDSYSEEQIIFNYSLW